jgi:hypothetical protein
MISATVDGGFLSGFFVGFGEDNISHYVTLRSHIGKIRNNPYKVGSL